MKFLTSNSIATTSNRIDCRKQLQKPNKMFVEPKRQSSTTRTTSTSKGLLVDCTKLLTRHVIMLLVIHLVLFSVLNQPTSHSSSSTHSRTSFGFAQATLQHMNLSPNVLRAPSFIKSMNELTIHENTPINKQIYTLEAVVDQEFAMDVRILYDIEETRLFGLEDRSSGRVRVVQQIDREQTGDSVSFQVVATPYIGNRPGTQTRLNITVYILDENDNAPQIERVRVGRQEFDNQALVRQAKPSLPFNLAYSPLISKASIPTIRLNVSEDAPNDSVVVDLIEAIDLDKVSSSPLGAVCLNCEPEFKLVPKTANLLNDRLDWSIVLAQQLVHVPRNNVRQLNVIVSDGKFNSSIEFEITIDDVQNKPPHFVSSTTCVVQENSPIDSTILTLEAIDGDALSLEDGPIFAAGNNQNRTSGAASLQQQGYSGRQIVYDFVNPITGQSSSRLDDFKLHPLTGQLQVANRLDREAYLEQNGVLSLQVRARELTVDAGTLGEAADDLYDSILNKLASFIDQSDSSTTMVEITVMVLDVNDNSPRWLNASEIAQMSQAPIWHHRLPNDRDTGRNYQIQVRENSQPGSPLTNKNEMFVFDLDAGDNAEFLIRLEDPFNLFDVEPKRVSGFSSVTLKLANVVQNPPSAGSSNSKSRQQQQQQQQQVLDYENINERSYIVQLYAQETRTNEQFKSKAQIQINVIDVNDNAPEFKEVAYVANIREDAPSGKTVKLVQATDRDEVSKQLRYSLHGQSAYLFDINAQSGLITVAKCEQQQQATSSRRFVAGTSNQHQQQAQKSCIDYETQRIHHLMVEASDGELSSMVPFVVYVEDASDNAPTFTLPIVDVVIEEGAQRLEPPIRIEATDVDQTSTLSYSIVEGNFEGFFAINNVTGELQLTRAIRIPHDDLSGGSMSQPTLEMAPDNTNLRHRQQQFNKMTLIVQASDGQHATNGTIRIDILDANDNAPQFSRVAYEKEISETATPGQSVLTVKAFDSDRGNNARVSYRIERGSHGQFDINEMTGEISVAQSAQPFDTNKRDNYTLEVVAYDHGLVSKSSSVAVLIRVVGLGRRAPEFSPKVQRVSISENTPNNTVIHRMTVGEINQPTTSQQQQMVLMFEPGPIEGLDKNGQPVTDIDRLESMLSVATNNGDVAITSGLNHDLAAYINLTLYVSHRPVSLYSNPTIIYDFPASANLTTSGDGGQDFSSLPTSAAQIQPDSTEMFRPRSVGYLIINVLDENEHASVFAPPWTPSQPELFYQMFEELPVGSILTYLVANDADSKISFFSIEPPNDYFMLASPNSGLIINRRLIDYDTLMRQKFLSPSTHRASLSSGSVPSATPTMPQQANNIIQFNVFAYDSGSRQLASKAIINVEILPVNDNVCKFEHQLYEINLKENALPDTVVTQVRASDLDFGENHNSIYYQLIGDQRDLFNIDTRTGVVTVSKRGSIGLDREQLAQPVISLTAVGRDNYEHMAESELASFGRSGARNLSNLQINGHFCSTTLRIHIEDINDNPPLFAQKVYDAIAYDTDTVDSPLVKLIVHDEDTKHGSTTNSTMSARNAQSTPAASQNTFRILSGNINDSFNISQSGMIYVTKPLNENLSLLGRSGSSLAIDQPIELRVQVKQQSSGLASGMGANAQAQSNVPALFTDECVVRVTIMKINRYAPEWRFEPNKAVSVEENSRPGSLVTQLKCTDRDFEPARSTPLDRYDSQSRPQAQAGSNRARQFNSQQLVSNQHQQASQIRYWIKENGANVLETSEFRLDSVSGNLITRVELDREKREFYQLIVSCEDNGKPQSLESITSLYITVLDADDNKPEFVVTRQHSTSSGQDHAHGMIQVPSSSPNPATMMKTITFVIEEQQSKGLQVGELKAVDKDLDTKQSISYCLLEGNEFQEFVLDHQTGMLFTNQTLDREKQAAYDLLVKAVNDGRSCEEHLAIHLAASSGQQANATTTTTTRPKPASSEHSSTPDVSLVRVRVELEDINDNAPVFKRHTFRAGVHHRALTSSLVTQVAAFDPDNGSNGTLNYRISEILLYKTSPSQQAARQGQYLSDSYHQGHHHQHHSHHHQPGSTSKPIKLIQLPFRIDQQGNIYTQQLLTQYQLMSMFVVQIEATETAEPWRTAATKLEIYTYETNNQLKIRINLHPRLIEVHQHEVELLLSNATRYTAIINKARSYNGNVDSLTSNTKSSSSLMPRSSSGSVLSSASKIPTLDLALQDAGSYHQQVPYLADINDPPQSSNILAIFVDNNRLVSPNLVMDKFDLTSAHLLLNGQHQFGNSGSQSELAIGTHHQAKSQDQQNEVGPPPLIDRVALASIQAAEYHASPSGLAGIDWLESPSVLFVCLSSMLALIGLIICLTGCCCTSRIKDHIIKVAMDKLVKQQTLQTKINERVLAATNQAAYASANGSVLGGHNQNNETTTLQSAVLGGHEFMLAQGGGFMSSFDATKGCLNNNYENMSILQRAMEAGEFFDPNYTTLTNNTAGHLNLGAHYYDASELENHDNANEKQYQPMNGNVAIDNSVVSLSLEDEDDDDDDNINYNNNQDGGKRRDQPDGNNYNPTANGGDLSNGLGQKQLAKKSKLYTNGLNGVVSSQSRLRQQIPNNQFNNDT